MGKISLSLLFCCIGFFIIPYVQTSYLEASRVPVIRIDGEKVYVEVQQSQLREVLKALADMVGLQLHIMQQDFGVEAVTLQWKGIRLEDALRNLLRNQSYALVHRSTPTGQVLSQVWVLGDKGDKDTNGTSPTIADVPKNSGGNDVASLEQLLLDLERKGEKIQKFELLLDRVQDPDPQIQRVALNFLMGSHPTMARKILTDRLHKGRDLASRQLAAYDLARMGEAGNVAALTQALQDPDPEARFMFLEVLKTMGDIARPAIAQAVHDPDPRVSKTAQIILNDMANHSPQ